MRKNYFEKVYEIIIIEFVFSENISLKNGDYLNAMALFAGSSTFPKSVLPSFAIRRGFFGVTTQLLCLLQPSENLED